MTRPMGLHGTSFDWFLKYSEVCVEVPEGFEPWPHRVAIGRSHTAIIAGAQNAIPQMEGSIPRFAKAAERFSNTQIECPDYEHGNSPASPLGEEPLDEGNAVPLNGIAYHVIPDREVPGILTTGSVTEKRAKWPCLYVHG